MMMMMIMIMMITDDDDDDGYLHAPMSGLPGNPLQKEGGVLVPRPME